MNLPETMTVIEISRPGGPEVLRPATRPVVPPGPGEVLIKVAAAGLNGADLKQRRDEYPMPSGAPDIPGLEVSGHVAAVGEGVNAWRIGEPVCALIAGGGYAEYALSPAPQCMVVPDGVNLIDAGGLPETFCTVWTNVFDRCGLQPGETLLVQGGSGGIGGTAVQLGKAFGCRVLATAGGPEKCRAVAALGCDRTIDHHREDFAEAVRDFTDGAGVDVILDVVGGDYIPRELEILRHNGRLVFVAFARGRMAEADFGLIHAKHLTVTGSRLRPRSINEKGAICRDLEKQIWPLFADGTLRPMTDTVFPLERAAAAHGHMEAGRHIGKVLLTMDRKH